LANILLFTAVVSHSDRFMHETTAKKVVWIWTAAKQRNSGHKLPLHSQIQLWLPIYETRERERERHTDITTGNTEGKGFVYKIQTDILPSFFAGTTDYLRNFELFCRISNEEHVALYAVVSCRYNCGQMIKMYQCFGIKEY